MGGIRPGKLERGAGVMSFSACQQIENCCIEMGTWRQAGYQTSAKSIPPATEYN